MDLEFLANIATIISLPISIIAIIVGGTACYKISVYIKNSNNQNNEANENSTIFKQNNRGN